MSNLFRDLPHLLEEEVVEVLLSAQDMRIERITSHGHASPADFWYDQPQDEWVILLKGAAKLQFREETLNLSPGDYVHIPAHCPHRVEWTTPDEESIWLAIHFGEGLDG